MKREEINVGGSSFWIFISLIAVTTLMFLLIWSFQENSVKGVVVSIIFLAMIFASILFSRFKIFDMASWGDNALSLTIGFIIWLGLGSFFGKQSIFSITENNLFATIASELPQIMEFSLNIFLIPIAEEMFWMVGLPFALITILNIIGDRYIFFKNQIFQIAFITIIGAITFAMFHVGKWFIAFIISAMIFRIVLMVIVYGESKFDLIKGINLVTGFAIGAHMANNIVANGITQSWLIIQSNFLPVGLMIVLFFGIMFLSAIDRVIGMVNKDKTPMKTFIERS